MIFHAGLNGGSLDDDIVDHVAVDWVAKWNGLGDDGGVGNGVDVLIGDVPEAKLLLDGGDEVLCVCLDGLGGVGIEGIEGFDGADEFFFGDLEIGAICSLQRGVGLC